MNYLSRQNLPNIVRTFQKTKKLPADLVSYQKVLTIACSHTNYSITMNEVILALAYALKDDKVIEKYFVTYAEIFHNDYFTIENERLQGSRKENFDINNPLLLKILSYIKKRFIEDYPFFGDGYLVYFINMIHTLSTDFSDSLKKSLMPYRSEAPNAGVINSSMKYLIMMILDGKLTKKDIMNLKNINFEIGLLLENNFLLLRSLGPKEKRVTSTRLRNLVVEFASYLLEYLLLEQDISKYYTFPSLLEIATKEPKDLFFKKFDDITVSNRNAFFDTYISSLQFEKSKKYVYSN